MILFLPWNLSNRGVPLSSLSAAHQCIINYAHANVLSLRTNFPNAIESYSFERAVMLNYRARIFGVRYCKQGHDLTNEKLVLFQLSDWFDVLWSLKRIVLLFNLLGVDVVVCANWSSTATNPNIRLVPHAVSSMRYPVIPSIIHPYSTLLIMSNAKSPLRAPPEAKISFQPPQNFLYVRKNWIQHNSSTTTDTTIP
jgi:hypothetical protein